MVLKMSKATLLRVQIDQSRNEDGARVLPGLDQIARPSEDSNARPVGLTMRQALDKTTPSTQPHAQRNGNVTTPLTELWCDVDEQCR
jgi:hypothetical protein